MERHVIVCLVLCNSLILAMAESDVKVNPGLSERHSGEVIVTATRTARLATELPASVTVINADDIKKASPQTIADLFRSSPGIQVQGGDVPGMPVRLSLRGLTIGHNAQHVLILIDGRRINDAYEGDIDASLLSFDAIDRIEILRGPASALYGSNATGGVINIITKRGTKQPFTEISITGGDYNTQHYTVRHGWETGKIDYFATVSHFLTDGYLQNSDRSKRDWEAVCADANCGISIDEETELRFFFGGYSGEGTDEASERQIRRDYQALSYGTCWDKEMDARLNVRIYRNGEERKYEWKWGTLGIYDYQTVGTEIQQSLWLGNEHQVVFGIEGRSDAVDIEEVSNPLDKTDGIFAFYLQDEIFISEAIRIMAGVRGDRSNVLGTKISPRAGIVYSFSSDVELFGTFNRAYRAPSLSHRYARIEWMGMMFEGNPSLESEAITSYEVGARARLGEKVQTELSAFSLSLEKGFDFMMVQDGLFLAQNVAQTEINGIEASMRYSIFRGITLHGTYTFTDGEYKDNPANPAIEGNQPEHLARHQGSAVLELSVLGGTHLLKCRYVSHRYGDAMNTPENRLNNYIVADLVSHIPVMDNVELTLKVQNVTDKDYYEYPGIESQGRSVYGGISISF